VAVTWKKPLVDAIRNAIDRVEREENVSADDPMLLRLKEKLVLRVVARDESPPANLDDLSAKSRE
jgi:hypothetical protein